MIEEAAIEDIPALCELLGELFSEEIDFHPDMARQAAGLELILTNPERGRIFVERRGDTVAAMVNLLFIANVTRGGRSILLEDLIVRRAFRRQGIATALLRYAFAYAKASGAADLTLLTDATNERAIALYTKMGFARGLRSPMRKYLHA